MGLKQSHSINPINLTNRPQYLQCLHKEDVAIILSSEKLSYNIPERIQLREYLYIIDQNKDRLMYDYRFYRQAYWGENIGRKQISKKKVNINVELYSCNNGKEIKDILISESKKLFYIIKNSISSHSNKIETFNFINSSYI